MVDIIRDEKGRIVKGQVLNPTGVGGFNERPQDRSRSWNKETAPGFLRKQYGRYTVEQLREELAKPDLTIFQIMVIQELLDAVNQKHELRDRQHIRENIENRVDGMPTSRTEITTDETSKPTVHIEFTDFKKETDDTEA